MSNEESITWENFSQCVDISTRAFKRCKKFARCDQRLFESKSMCDESFRKATRADNENMRERFRAMDACFADSLEAHWTCTDEVKTSEAK